MSLLYFIFVFVSCLQCLPLELFKRDGRSIRFFDLELKENLHKIERSTIQYAALYDGKNKEVPLSIYRTGVVDNINDFSRDHILGYDSVGKEYLHWIESNAQYLKEKDGKPLSKERLKEYASMFNDDILNSRDNLMITDYVFNSEVKNEYEVTQVSKLRNDELSISQGNRELYDKNWVRSKAVELYLNSKAYSSLQEISFEKNEKLLHHFDFDEHTIKTLKELLFKLQHEQNQKIMDRVHMMQNMLEKYSTKTIYKELQVRAEMADQKTSGKDKMNALSSLGNYVLKMNGFDKEAVHEFMRSEAGQQMLSKIHKMKADNPKEKRFDKMLERLLAL